MRERERERERPTDAGTKTCAFWAVMWTCGERERERERERCGFVGGGIGVGCMFLCGCAVFDER